MKLKQLFGSFRPLAGMNLFGKMIQRKVSYKDNGLCSFPK